MLWKTEIVSQTTALRQPKTIFPVEIIRAHSIAHAKMATWERAEKAAAWIDGRALLIPTAQVASEVFGVSKPMIAASRQPAHPGLDPLKLMARGWHEASADYRAAFVSEYENDIWAALERVADTQR